MVREGTMLGHLISEQGIEVDRAKVEVIEKMPPLTSIKGVRSFLEHAKFYRLFIKNFSKIAIPLTNLLTEEANFLSDQVCMGAVRKLKEALL